MEEQDALLTTPQAAAILKMAPGTLSNWRLAGVGPPWRRVGSRAVRYLQSELLAWASGQPWGVQL